MHIPADQIALITFTRYAAEEMRKRLKSHSRGMFIGTFHSFAMSLLKQHGRTRGWDPAWLTILDEDEAALDEREILRMTGIIGRKNQWLRASASYWQKFRREVESGTYDAKQYDDDTAHEHCIAAWRAFYNRMKAENCLTFAMMLMEIDAMLDDPAALASIRGQYKHLLVDEAQDTDTIQWRILTKIDPDTIFCVGDGDQSIYEWRGACPTLFREFADTADRFDLPNSYRFGFNIANPANKLIQRNQNRLDIAINAISSNHGTVQVINDCEFSTMLPAVKAMLDAGTPPQHIAILSRRHATLDGIQRHMEADKLPIFRAGGSQDTDVLKSGEFRAVRGYLRLMVNPSDRRAFMAIAAPEHLSDAKLMDLRETVVKTGESMLSAYKKPLPASLDDLTRYLEAQDPANDYRAVFDALEAILFYEGIRRDDTAALVEYLAFQSDQDKLRQNTDKITLCTIHAAKGLEWPIVFIIGMNAKEFPSPRAILEARHEEERRLCYVAMTRAIEQLFLVHSDPNDPASSFIAETAVTDTMLKPETDEDQIPM
jgi:DNA helicase-2/ATP-dependent DNA helicase PcrA